MSVEADGVARILLDQRQEFAINQRLYMCPGFDKAPYEKNNKLAVTQLLNQKPYGAL